MTRRARTSKQKKTVVQRLSTVSGDIREHSKDFEFWEPYWGYERPDSHRRPAGYVKEGRILEWALPHSKWLRSRAWLVGKSRPETVDICQDEGGQFDDVEGEEELTDQSAVRTL